MTPPITEFLRLRILFYEKKYQFSPYAAGG